MSNAPNNQTLVTTTRTENGLKEYTWAETPASAYSGVKNYISGLYSPWPTHTEEPLTYEVTWNEYYGFSTVPKKKTVTRQARYKNLQIKNLSITEGVADSWAAIPGKFSDITLPTTEVFENGETDRDGIKWETSIDVDPSGAEPCSSTLVPLSSNSGWVLQGTNNYNYSYNVNRADGGRGWRSKVELVATWDEEWELEDSFPLSGPEWPINKSSEMKEVIIIGPVLDPLVGPIITSSGWIPKKASEMGFSQKISKSYTKTKRADQVLKVTRWEKEDKFQGSCIACCCTCSGEGYPPIDSCPPGYKLTGITFPQWQNCSAANGFAVWESETTCMYCIYE